MMVFSYFLNNVTSEAFMSNIRLFPTVFFFEKFTIAIVGIGEEIYLLKNLFISLKQLNIILF